MSKGKLGIMTIVSGSKYQEIWKRSRPYFEDYADRCGADLLVLDNLPDNLPSPHWAKFSIYELLKKQYDRIAFIDADSLIRPDAPSLFDIVPEDQFGIFNEGTYTPRAVCIHELRKVYNVTLKKWNGKDYYNTGVMVASRQHRFLFKVTEEVKPLRNSFGEQTYLNLKLMVSGVKIFSLPYQFNRMSIMDRVIGISRLDSYFVHYAGFDMLFGEGKTLEAMDLDIERWKKDAPDYKYKRKIFLWALGGMGDVIAAEPTIRFMREKIYPDADIYLLTKKYFHPLFKHIKGLEMIEDGDVLAEKIDAVLEFNTHPTIHDADNNFETSFGKYCPHPMLHSVDWVSICCTNRQLNRAQKQIKLTYTEDDLNEILKICEKPEDLILIHPGRGWETKNFPVEWWQEVLDTLDRKGFKVGLIGKHVDNEHGYMPVKCPPNGVDFRDKTSIMGMVALIDQAPVLISNDSAPVFIGGAFDNYIILIPTCKEGDLIMPYRNGEQGYKNVMLGKKVIRDDMPFRVPDYNVWQIRYFPEGHSIEEYLPETGEVINKAIQFFNQAKKIVWLETTKEAVNE
jgi:ADP-heptose:LPS heptosyltransferase